MDKEQTLLEMKGITKVFPGVKALDNVDLEVKKVRYWPCSVKTEQGSPPS
ncbi:hypothetical protein [Faecalicatena contorta]